MKRLVCATLALSLMGATAANAGSYHRYDRGHHGGGRHGDNTGALIGLGIGLFALGAIVAASQDDDRDRAYRANYRGDFRGDYRNYRGNAYR